MIQSSEKKGLWSKSFIFMIIINTFTSISAFMLSATLNPYLNSIGYTAALVGVISGASSAASMFSRICSGSMNNRMDRKRLFILFSVLEALSIVGLGYVQAAVPLLVLRLLQGFCYAVISTAGMTIVAGCLPDDRLGEGIGFYGLSQIIPICLAPAAGLGLAAAVGFRNMLYCAGLCAIIGAGIMLLIEVEAAPQQKIQTRGIKLNELIAPEAVPSAMTAMFFAVLNGTVMNYIVLYASDKCIDGIAWFYILYGLGTLLVRSFGGKLADRNRFSTNAALAGCLGAIAMACLWLGHSSTTLFIAGMSFGLCYGLIIPVAQSTCILRTAPERSGTATGTYFLGIDVGMFCGASGGGLAIDAWGYSNMFGLCIISIAAAIAVAYVLVDKTDKKQPT